MKLEKVNKLEHLLTLTGHSGAVLCVNVCAAFAIAVSGSSDQSAIVWDLNTGKLRCILGSHYGPVLSISVHRINGNIITLTNKELRIYTVNGNLLVKVFMEDSINGSPFAEATALCAIPCPDWQSGVVAVTGHADGSLALWTFENDQPSTSTTRRLRVFQILKDSSHKTEITSIHLFATSADNSSSTARPIDKVYVASNQQELLVGDSSGYCSRWAPVKIDQITQNKAKDILMQAYDVTNPGVTTSVTKN
jgi:WD40 repeat protein